MYKKCYLWLSLVSLVCLFTLFSPASLYAVENDPYETKRQMFETMQGITGVPWEYLAAMDIYEKNIHLHPKDPQKNSRTIAIEVPSHQWAGLLNPDLNDKNTASIRFFNGIGHDGDGDGIADPNHDLDILISVSKFLTKNGMTESHVRSQLWHYYLHPTTVDVITHIAKIFQKYPRLQLNEHTFPISPGYSYSYRNTWGAKRGWGGRRIHEGTDIFANYGTPVQSTCYGYVELIGWNRFGGWRIGIRDTNNNYHYFAHLNGFKKGLQKGDIVKPGQLIGSVGSSGYGPPGTAGKFPPHLHYGIYKFNGKNTYSFDPYPQLKQWEKNAHKKRKESRNTSIHK
ncbi:M23 family metallopeptidase [Hazenella sp. IB182357]|uniref:M23 family metallopeptidase n=1 Tax=Polycladospora coralii TaxID=2771432 RepID=A0A926RT93_9BACL|nr:M23 family metallopeptidase [Polycladospora coralii]MBD1370859.1 M23 family metallopeptidase [Polycladospora coralii]MBS7529798.1 M23 family metallopeptidase [Polycladospora coralii]